MLSWMSEKKPADNGGHSPAVNAFITFLARLYASFGAMPEEDMQERITNNIKDDQYVQVTSVHYMDLGQSAKEHKALQEVIDKGSFVFEECVVFVPKEAIQLRCSENFERQTITVNLTLLRLEPKLEDCFEPGSP